MQQNVFSSLTPDLIISAAETFTGNRFDGTITPYNSYVNRVFGLTDESGGEYIIKFYRPGRWDAGAIIDEHQFLADCAENEVPVIPPLISPQTALPENTESNNNGTASTLGNAYGLYFALFPRLRARTFDIYSDGDWIRTGRAVGRMHRAAQLHEAPHRLQCTPQQTTIPYITMLLEHNFVTPELQQEFTTVCNNALDYVLDAYAACFGEADEDGIYHTTSFRRIHGDCHRGNILEQSISPSPADIDAEDTLTITFIDFDDMMSGPAVQDLWLLLPGYVKDSQHELNLLLEGYEQFIPEAETTVSLRSEIRLIEPLRFMRHIYFLAWTGMQYYDKGFTSRNPLWGTKAFWEKEIEDLKTQLHVLENEYNTLQECCPEKI
jgi:Ser/Thr protein kinase RdoA (MazF antagonist)